MVNTLRVLAVSGPHWPIRPKEVCIKSLSAASPFSLQNAVRQAAGFAADGVGVWADSNWTNLEGRQESVLLLEFMDEARIILEERLATLKPNLVLIGAMTLGFRGAIEVARLVRNALGSQCLIVLGGKHANETMRVFASQVTLLPSSPLTLMQKGVIECSDNKPLFDLVVSGDGEELITVLGEIVYERTRLGGIVSDAIGDGRQLKRAKGNWCAGWLQDGAIHTIKSAGLVIPFDKVPTAPSLFGLQSRFPVFDGGLTGHAYSDMGRGCRYNCFFCSERVVLNGRPHSHGDPVSRLYRHLEDIWIAGGKGECGMIGAFVEDSILLGGHDRYITNLVEHLIANPLPGLKVGCQLTVNDIARLKSNQSLARFANAGIDYVAFGMETINEGVASRMSKHRRPGLWSEANRSALEFLSESRLLAGVFLLWGLGENQWEREHQIQQLLEWKDRYNGQPCAVGLNWATLHPGVVPDVDNEKNRWPTSTHEMTHSTTLPDFVEWGTLPESGRLQAFVELFGEASENYPYYCGVIPSEHELTRLRPLCRKLLADPP
ncbi:MAG: radical SAM protein [Nitrospira sp. CR2.1]|nr:radical SAM protein [Nitrospira sp. CR2.1]